MPIVRSENYITLFLKPNIIITMKSFTIILVLLCMILTGTSIAQTNGGRNNNEVSGNSILGPSVKLLDSVYRYDWNDAGSQWILTQKQYKLKNSSGSLVNDQTLIFDSLSGLWKVTQKTLYEYFPDGDAISQISGMILNNLADTFATNLFTHYIKPGLIDEYYLKSWDQGTHSFTGGSRTLTTFNSMDTVTQVIQQVLDPATQSWINGSRETNSHDSVNQLSGRLLEVWLISTSTWINSTRATFTHDTLGFLTGRIDENWDPVSSIWRNSMRTSIYVKGSGLIDSILVDTWAVGPQTWNPDTRSVFIYSSDGLIYNRRDQEYNNSTLTWDDKFLTLYTYFTGTSNLKTITGQFWNPITTDWIKYYLSRNDSVGHNTEVYEKYWNISTYDFTGGYRNSWVFDANGLKTSFLYQNYDTAVGNWANNFHDLYTYDAETHLTEDLYQTWSTGLGDWVNSRKWVYYFNEFAGIEDLQNTVSCFHANPMQPGSYISCPSFAAGKSYTLSMYSVTGTLVYSIPFQGGTSVQVGKDLPGGIYVIVIRDSGRDVYRDKVILVK